MKIYSKQHSDNVLNGKIGEKKFSVCFKALAKTEVSEKQYEALLAENNSALSWLIAHGEFVVDAEYATNEVANLKGEIVKLQEMLKAAEAKSKLIDEEAAKLALEKAVKALEDTKALYESCEDKEQKKELKKQLEKAADNVKALKK